MSLKVTLSNSTRATRLKKDLSVDLANRNGLMVVITRANGRTTRLQAWVNSGTSMETHMKAIGLTIKLMATAFCSTRMVQCT